MITKEIAPDKWFVVEGNQCWIEEKAKQHTKHQFISTPEELPVNLSVEVINPNLVKIAGCIYVEIHRTNNDALVVSTEKAWFTKVGYLGKT